MKLGLGALSDRSTTTSSQARFRGVGRAEIGLPPLVRALIGRTPLDLPSPRRPPGPAGHFVLSLARSATLRPSLAARAVLTRHEGRAALVDLQQSQVHGGRFEFGVQADTPTWPIGHHSPVDSLRSIPSPAPIFGRDLLQSSQM